MKIEFQVGEEQALGHTSGVWVAAFLVAIVSWFTPWTEQSPSGDKQGERET